MPKCSATSLDLLDSAEKLAMDTATAQVRRMESVPPNTCAVLIIAVERLEHALAHARRGSLECDADDSDG